MTDSELLGTIDKKLDNLIIVVKGNGVKGHAQRIEELEDWKGGHPIVCPQVKKAKDILKVRALEVSIIGLVIAATQLIAKALGVL